MKCESIHSTLRDDLNVVSNWIKENNSLYRKEAPMKFSTSFRVLRIRPPPSLLRADEDLLNEATHLNETGTLLKRVLKGRIVINPCVAKLDGAFYYAAREHMKLGPARNNWWSNIVIGELPRISGRSLPSIINSKSRYLKTRLKLPPAIAKCLYRQPGHYITGPADPRLYSYKGQLWVTFSYYSLLAPEASRSVSSSCSEMRAYSGAVWIQKLTSDSSAVELFAKTPRMPVEKNWIFFSQPSTLRTTEKLLGVRSVEPHIIVDVSVKSGECEEVARTSSPYLFAHIPANSRLHLGAIPARLSRRSLLHHTPAGLKFLQEFKSVQLGMFHSKITVPARIYKHYFYVFNEFYPYEVLCVSLTPVSPPRKSSTSFETSVLIDGDGESVVSVNVWFGVDDQAGGMASFLLQDVLKDMFCLKSPSLTSRISQRGSMHSQTYPRLQSIRFSPLLRSSQGFFNPSVLALPAGSTYPFVAVARAPPIKTTFRGPASNKSWIVHKSALIACVLDASFNCVGSPKQLDLPIPYRAIEKRLVSRPDDDQSYCYDAYIGAEDGRLVWSSGSRQVLLSYGMNSEVDHLSSRNIWIVALAEVYPFLKRVLPNSRRVEHRRRSMYAVPTEIVYKNASHVEKNWIMYGEGDKLYISYSLHPRMTLQPLPYGSIGSLTFVKQDIFSGLNPGTYSINQGTGIMRVKLCVSRSCRWDTEERLISIFHTRHRKIGETFKHFLAVMKIEQPFRVEAIVPLTQFERFWIESSGSRRFVYPMSLDFMKSFDRTSRQSSPISSSQTATLDSVAMIGIGVDDETSHVFTVPVFLLLDSYLVATNRTMDICA
jgi:hypothetical protein